MRQQRVSASKTDFGWIREQRLSSATPFPVRNLRTVQANQQTLAVEIRSIVAAASRNDVQAIRRSSYLGPATSLATGNTTEAIGVWSESILATQIPASETA